MKRLRLSVLGILAMIFAISSSFSSSGLVTTWTVSPDPLNWGVLMEQPGSQVLDELSALSCEIDDIVCFIVTRHEDGVPAEIVDFRDGDLIE